MQPPGLDKPWIALVVRSRKEHPSCTFDTKASRWQLLFCPRPVALRHVEHWPCGFQGNRGPRR